MKKAYKIIKEDLKGSHDYSHIMRTLKYARILNRKYNGNWKVIEASILLHEITKNKPENSKIFLKEFSVEEINNVIHCIETHYCLSNKKPTTIESKIVRDCDSLDMLGAIGIARGFMSAGEKGLNFTKAKNEYEKKRIKVFDKLILKESKKIGEKKIKFTKNFFKTINEEINKGV